MGRAAGRMCAPPEVERIPPRSGLSRAEVIANQRRRIFEGLAAALAYHGYEDTKITDVVELAGVSRATFYEHFEARRPASRPPMRTGWSGSPPRSRRLAVARATGTPGLSAGLRAGLEFLAADPPLAHLLLVESLAAARPARLEHERSLVAPCRSAAPACRAPSGGEVVPEETVRLLAGGLASHLSGRVLAGEAERLAEDHDLLLQYLLAPIRSGRCPGRHRLTPSRSASSPATSPRCRPSSPSRGCRPAATACRAPSSPATSAAASIAAMLRVLPRHGYPATTIGHIDPEARVSRAAFYDSSRARRSAFRRPTTSPPSGSATGSSSLSPSAVSWPPRVRAGVSEALRLLGANPEIAHLIAVEALQAGPFARQRRQGLPRAPRRCASRGSPEPAEIPLDLDELLVGGVSRIARQSTVGVHSSCPRSTAELVQYLLIPYLTRGDEADRRRSRSARAPSKPRYTF